MYAGFIVETATTADLFARPSHPYTVGLLHSIPRVDEREVEELIPIEGRPPDMRQAPTGCPFAPRCAWRLPVCWEVNPGLAPLDRATSVVLTGPAATHRIACHNPPTPDEVAHGRPVREGFRPAPPPSGRIEELATVEDALADAAEVEAWVDSIRETGAELPLGQGPSALPLPPDPSDPGDEGRP
jgi:oligopeptide/dipeptide ABC transporter ATP-binding protein